MKRITRIALGWLVLIATSQAASFDCAKAATKVEKIICDDAEISRLDEELSAAYKSAIQVGKQADTINQAQKQWLKERNECPESVCVKTAYQARLSVLVDTHTSNPQIFSVEALKTTCIDLTGIKIGSGPDDDAAECSVTEFGVIGTVNSQTYYYSIYCLMPDYSIKEGGCTSGSFSAQYNKARAITVFVANGEAGKATLWREFAEPEIGLTWHDKPELIANSFGTILYLPIHVDGTGAGNISEYYLWDEKSRQWQKLDANSWLKDIKIPPGLAINKGIWPDLKNMTAEAYLYRSGDANCCPTGGTAHIQLTIENSRFAVKSVTIDPKNLYENK